MAIEHVNIADGERHEPKGASTATVDQVYASNGAGSGTWREVPYQDTVILDDVSNPSFVLMPIPNNVKIQSIRYTLFNAITVADSTITVTRGDGASLGTKVIAFTGSAEGTTFDHTPSGNNTITASTHKYLKFATDGASTTTAKMAITIKAKVV
jgi:hypothetical protein